MAGEHILKLLVEENARVEVGDRWMLLCYLPTKPGGIEYTVYQQKSYAKKTTILIQTQNEKEACRILKG